MPDHLKGTSYEETVGKIWPALDGMIKSQAERGAVPKESAGYAWTPPDALKPVAEHLGKDPEFVAFRDMAHKAGVTDKQFQVLMDQLGPRVQGAATVLGQFEPETNGDLLTGNRGWIDNMAQQGRFSAGVKAELDMLAVSRHGSEVIAMLQQSLSPGYAAAPAGGAQAANTFGVVDPPSLAAARQMVGDPRYMTDSSKYDAQFRKWADQQIDRFEAEARKPKN